MALPISRHTGHGTTNGRGFEVQEAWVEGRCGECKGKAQAKTMQSNGRWTSTSRTKGKEGTQAETIDVFQPMDHGESRRPNIRWLYGWMEVKMQRGEKQRNKRKVCVTEHVAFHTTANNPIRPSQPSPRAQAPEVEPCIQGWEQNHTCSSCGALELQDGRVTAEPTHQPSTNLPTPPTVLCLPFALTMATRMSTTQWKPLQQSAPAVRSPAMAYHLVVFLQTVVIIVAQLLPDGDVPSREKTNVR